MKLIYPNEVIKGKKYIIKMLMHSGYRIDNVICIGVVGEFPIFKDLEDGRVFPFNQIPNKNIYEEEAN